MAVIDKEAFDVFERVMLECFEEHTQLAFQRDGFTGVIALCERLADAAKQYGRGNGASHDEVLAKLSTYFMREVDVELRS